MRPGGEPSTPSPDGKSPSSPVSSRSSRRAASSGVSPGSISPPTGSQRSSRLCRTSRISPALRQKTATENARRSVISSRLKVGPPDTEPERGPEHEWQHDDAEDHPSRHPPLPQVSSLEGGRDDDQNHRDPTQNERYAHVTHARSVTPAHRARQVAGPLTLT